MVAIVSGNSLGLDLTTLGTAGQRGVFGEAGLGQTKERTYVNAATGNLVVQNVDDYVASSGNDIAVVRTYNSLGQFGDDNGDNWSNGFYTRQLTYNVTVAAVNSVGSTIARTAADGSSMTFTYQVAGRFAGLYTASQDAGAVDTFKVADAGGAFTFTWTDGQTGSSEVYAQTLAGEGRLTATTDNRGATTSFDYNANGRCSKVTDASGESIVYVYDTSGTKTNLLREVRYINRQGVDENHVRYEYDANGFLTAVSDSTLGANDRSFVNDASGKVLYAKQGTHIQRQLVVNGEVLGRYGEVVDDTKPKTSNGSAVFTTSADFNFGYTATAGKTPQTPDSVHVVVAGDTLEVIAKQVYGDSRLWYRIADANGMTSNADLKAGQVLKVPGTQTNGNDANTFKPYNPSDVVGDTLPNMPAFVKKHDVFAQLLALVVAVIVTAYLGPVAGNVASQAVNIATGEQRSFSWKQVGMAYVSAGITQGMGELIPETSWLSGSDIAPTAARAAIANAVTQGVGVMTGLQNKFDWRGVAASAAGAGVGSAVGGPLGVAFGSSAAGQFGARLATGLIAGATTAVMRGGRISVQQIATDAFGNAIGEELAYGSTSGDTTPTTGDFARMDGNDYRSESYRPSLTAAQQKTMAMGYGPLTPDAAIRVVAVHGIEPNEIADGAAIEVDKMGQPLNGRSSYNAFTQIGKIASAAGSDSIGTSVAKLWDWATYTTPDAGQRGAEIRARYGNDPRFAQIDQMRDSPLGAIGWGIANLSGARQETQQMLLDVGTSLDGLAMSAAGLAGRAAAYTGARTMPELIGEPKLFERYEATRVNIEREMFRTPSDELSAVISRETGAVLSRQLIPGVAGTLNPEMLGSMPSNTFTHFHPSGGNFSLSDIRTGLATGTAEIRAVMDGRTVSLNFEGAPNGLLGNPIEVVNFMGPEGKAAFNAITSATRLGVLPPQGTAAANIQISDFAVKTFVARNPWVKYAETKN